MLHVLIENKYYIASPQNKIEMSKEGKIEKIAQKDIFHSKTSNQDGLDEIKEELELLQNEVRTTSSVNSLENEILAEEVGAETKDALESFETNLDEVSNLHLDIASNLEVLHNQLDLFQDAISSI